MLTTLRPNLFAKLSVVGEHSLQGVGRSFPASPKQCTMPAPPTPDNSTIRPRYRIADLEVDVGKAEVTRGEKTIALPKLSFDLLCALIDAAPAIASNEELLERVWPGLQVSPESVAQRVKLLRSAIGDDSQQPRYILGVRGRGYRLIPVPERLAEWRPPTVEASNPATSAASLTGVGQGSAPVSRALPPRGNGQVKRAAVAAAVFIAIGVAVWVGWRSWSSSHNSAQSHTVAMTDKSIAVLPFTDMSEKKDQEYFGDGMAEEIIDLLTKLPFLKITARTSSFQFKGKTQDLSSIGAQLGVAYVLEGSVRKSGDRMRVTAQLIDCRSGTPRWSQTYDQDFGEVLKLQDEIATQVVRLVENDAYYSEIVSGKTLRSTEAYTAYLQGRYARDRFDQPGLEQAIVDFQRALELDPTFADAAAGLANVYQNLGAFGLMPPAEAFEKARRAAQLAIKLDPTQPEAHAVLSNIHITYDWDWPAADREYELAAAGAPLAIQVDPLLALTMGRWDDALKAFNRGVAVDPMDADNYFFVGLTQLRRGRLAEAKAALTRTIELSPTYTFAHYSLALAALARNEPEKALVEFSMESGEAARLVGSALAYFRLGKKSDSDAALAQFIKSYGDFAPSGVASIYAYRGESDEAFKWLDRAYAQKDTLVSGIKYRTEFDKLRADPRYKAFLKKMKLPE
jgi:TolB-like protein/DNA-binding winged helix-turn-helix (wHTH) protein/Flp pilus assembly protein TadD